MDTGASAGRTRHSEEDELLCAVAEGDTDALRRLYRAFERPLYTLGIRWLHDEKLAEELVQEVTLRVWRRASRYDPNRGAAGSWIFGIARNVASDLARAKGRQPIPVGELPVERADPWDDEAAWRGWQVALVVGKLPLAQQKIVELAYVHQFTQSEIAQSLDIPLGTVKTRLYDALRKLRRMLVESGVIEEQT